MRWYKIFVKRVVSGVILFLLPVTLLLFILSKAFTFLQKLLLPVKNYLPAERVMGFGMLTFISIILIVLICFIAGVLSETKYIKAFIVKVEDSLLVMIPGYAMIKSRASDAISEADDKWRSVFVREGDNWRLGIEVDRKQGSHSTIFFPGPPDPKSGVLSLVPQSKIKYLDVPVSEVVRSIRKYGEGTSSWLNTEADVSKH